MCDLEPPCYKATTISKVKEYALAFCRNVEALPTFKGGTVEEKRQQRYPFERSIDNYKRKLPDLHECLQGLSCDSSVLDIGMGRGVALAQIAVETQCRMVGTSIQTVPDRLCPLVLAVASSLPFGDGVFDLVLSVQGIAWEPDQHSALTEVRRVLRRGGTGLVYLYPFSDCMLLWHTGSFWDAVGVDYDSYKKYEFEPREYSHREGFEVSVSEVEDRYLSHTSAYYVRITK